MLCICKNLIQQNVVSMSQLIVSGKDFCPKMVSMFSTTRNEARQQFPSPVTTQVASSEPSRRFTARRIAPEDFLMAAFRGELGTVKAYLENEENDIAVVFDAANGFKMREKGFCDREINGDYEANNALQIAMRKKHTKLMEIFLALPNKRLKKLVTWIGHSSKNDFLMCALQFKAITDSHIQRFIDLGAPLMTGENNLAICAAIQCRSFETIQMLFHTRKLKIVKELKKNLPRVPISLISLIAEYASEEKIYANAQSGWRYPLQYAIEARDARVVKLLIDSGADASQRITYYNQNPGRIQSYIRGSMSDYARHHNLDNDTVALLEQAEQAKELTGWEKWLAKTGRKIR